MPITYYHDAPIQMPLDLARRAGQYAGQAEIGKEMRARQAQQTSQIQEMAFREQQAQYDRDLQIQKMHQDSLARQQQMDFQKEMAQQQQADSLNKMMVASDFERAEMLSKEKAKKESLGYTYTKEDTKRMNELRNALEKVRTASNLNPLQRAQAAAGLQSELSSMMPTEAPYKGNLTDDQLYELETKGGYIVTDPTTGERTRYMKDGVGGIMEDDKFAQRQTQLKIAELQNVFKKQEAELKKAESERASKQKQIDAQLKNYQKLKDAKVNEFNKLSSEISKAESDAAGEINRINNMISRNKSDIAKLDAEEDAARIASLQENISQLEVEIRNAESRKRDRVTELKQQQSRADLMSGYYDRKMQEASAGQESEEPSQMARPEPQEQQAQARQAISSFIETGDLSGIDLNNQSHRDELARVIANIERQNPELAKRFANSIMGR